MNKLILTNLLRLCSFALLISMPGWLSAQVFTANPSLPIGPGPSTHESTLNVAGLPGDGVLNKDVGILEVCVDIQHTWASDLTVSLTTPSGRTINLFAADGGTTGFDTRAVLCLSGTGVGAPVENWNSGNPEPNNPWMPDGTINATCDNYSGPDTANGEWTLNVADNSAGDAGTLFSWSIEFQPLTCEITGIENVSIPAPDGICEDIPVSIPVPSTAGCDEIPNFANFSNTVGLNFNPNLVETPNTIDVSSYTVGNAVGPIQLTLLANGDFTGPTFEVFEVEYPDGTLSGPLNNGGADCAEQGSTVSIPAATWDSWVTNFGPNLTFTCQADAAVNNICATQEFTVMASVPQAGAFMVINSINGTDDASGNFQIGITDYYWCAKDPSGFDIICPATVTILPDFVSCQDYTLHAGPGECEAVVNYDTSLTCPVGNELVLTVIDTTAIVDNAYRCGAAVGEGTTYFQIFDNPDGFNVTGLGIRIRETFGGYTGGNTMGTINLYRLTNPNDPTCPNRTLIGTFGPTLIPVFTDPSLTANFFWKIPMTTGPQPGGQLMIEAGWVTGAPGGLAGDWPYGQNMAINGGNSTYIAGAPLFCTTDLCNPDLGPNSVPAAPADLIAYIEGFTAASIEITGPRPWEYVPIGDTSVCMVVRFPNGDSSKCMFNITVDEYPNGITALACNDDIQLSLDEDCMATVGADMVLEGGPYGCYDDFVVTVENDRGVIQDMDNDPSNGTQLGWTHIGNCYKVTVLDPTTGNSCWGNICVEDKLPPIITACPNDTVDCETNTDPLCNGGGVPCPSVADACSPFVTAAYVDWETDGSCETGTDRIINRRWTFTDASGNTATCEQTIVVELSTLFDVVVPSNYDDITNPALLCDEKYDASKDVTPHILDFPFCVDGYLLDSAIWLATGGDPTIPDPDARDLSGTRLPMTLGWNCLDSGPYEGHPSPVGEYYDPHPQWQFFGVCWGPNEVVKWQGTGLPLGTACFNIHYEYRDTRIDLYDPECDAGDVGCFKVLRQWTVFDWCTGEVGGHNQIIKVLDNEGPEILAPDEIEVGTDPWFCLGRFDVPAPWIIDNCSNDVDYRVTTKYGNVFGNPENGYIVTDIPIGSWPLYIEAFDCCGNRTVDSIIMNVEDNTPPVAICEDRVQLSLSGNQSPGSNYAAICAEDLDKASYDNCTEWLWFKMIRMDELLGTVNGSFADNTVACGGINGDDDALITGNQVYFDDCSKFCCDDAGNVVMVALRVHDVDPGAGPVNPSRYTPPAGDLVGRFTDCWVEIDVVDKAQPLVVAPPDIVVSCMFWFDDSEDALSDPTNATFGRVVTDLNDRQKVKTTDIVCEEWCEDHPKYDYEPSRNTPIIWSQACDYYNAYYNDAHPDDKYELVWGFDGYVLRTCGAQPEIRVDDRRECGQGVILRDVIVSYQDPKTGGVVTFRDRQEIWVIDCDPFYATEDCFDDDDCIEWPLFCQQPDPLDGCGADLDPYTNPDLGFPVIANGCDDNCALVAVDYVDEVYTIEPDACFKVIRTWIVIDWCTYDPLAPKEYDGDNPNVVTPGRYEFVQSIVVRDKIDPVVTVDVGDCEPAVFVDSLGTCVGHIDICATATDDCSPDDWIVYDYKVDAFSDGVGQFGDFDYYVGKLTLRQFNNGTTLEQDPTDCEAYNQNGYCNPFADDPTQPFCASGTYPVGTHTFYFFAEDGCGNVVKWTEVVEILDCKEPTPYCKNGIITVVMPSNGEICVWANDLDDGSFDNCTAQENLKFYFNGDSTMTSYCINCDTFADRGADDKVLIDVEVWVEDEEGNKDFCVTTIEVQDNNDVCDGPGSLVGGDVNNPLMTEPVEDVEVYINGQMTQASQLTGNNGKYSYKFPAAPGDFTVAPYNNNDPLNGVSTADLVAIQRHLLGISELTSGYQMIAADVNNTQSVSAADMSALRQVILGRYADFSQWSDQTSWRFADAGVNLADNMSPWPFTEEMTYNNVQTDMFDINFHAIKIGDVTGDAINHSLTGNSTRSNGNVALTTEESDLVAGDTYTMEVTSSDFAEISGYQFTMKYDASALSFTGTQAGVLEIGTGNVGTARVSEGLITMSWNDMAGQPVSVSSDKVLFSLTFDVLADAKASEVVNINSLVTAAEAYDADINVKGLTLEFRNGSEVVEVFDLYQNVPNPFKGSTVIGYTLPSDMPAVLTVYDVSGKVLLVRDVDGKRGYNEEMIRNTELNGAGVLYYQLDAADYTATKRMVLID